MNTASVGWVFPGQGSQFVGMGRELYTQVTIAREVFDQADATLGMNIARLCFEGPEKALTATENAQPALLTVSVALLRVLDAFAVEHGVVRPQLVAGHSLGEYAALVAGGALDFVTAVKLVRRRGELMAEAREGTMAAIIGIEEYQLDQVCQEVSSTLPGDIQDDALAVIANYNAPGQFVISGSTTAIKQACKLAKEQGAKRALPLKVSAAFHSPLMATAAEGMAGLIDRAPVSDLTSSLVTNVHAEPISQANEVRRELVTQIVSPVRWVAVIQRMVQQGISTFVEIGPGSVLTGLIKRIVPGVRLINLSSIEDIRAFVQEKRQDLIQK